MYLSIEKKRFNIETIIPFIVLGLISLAFVLPIIVVYSVSFASESEIVREGFKFIPGEFSLVSYKYIFKSPEQILNSYGVTLLVLCIGTFLSLLFMSMIAYPLSRRDFIFRKYLSLYVLIVLLFNGGLVPFYINIITYFPFLKNNIWGLIVPYLCIPWYILLLKSFFTSIPIEIIESAKIDGASEYRTFFTIVIPLSKPGLATIGTFVGLFYWNDWWLSLLFIEDRSLYSIQMLLYSIMNNLQAMIDAVTSGVNVDLGELPTESMRMAMGVLALTPMLLIFPFFQKYFERGINVGAVKG
jgi:putative aldouronate transport system permease protein